jgi:hypothetical protein
MAHVLVKLPRVNAISVMDQEAIRVVNRQCFAQLLKRPVGGGVSRDIDVEETAMSLTGLLVSES